jgi:hypothetical protein
MERESHERQIVASFYYSYREGEQQTNHSNMLRSILYDILDQNEEFFFHFQRYHRQRGQVLWSYDSLKRILLSLIENHPVEERLHLIVDAMDESTEGDRYDIIDFLHEICTRKRPCIVKVFIASRPIDKLNRFSAENHKTIQLEDVNSPDIVEFVESFLSKLKLPPEIIRQAKDYIVRHAQGVFVWVHLVRKELCRYAERGYTLNKIFRFLESLPTELQGFYQRIILQLEAGEAQDIAVGQRMLQFVLFAYRPLRLEGLRQAPAIPDNLEDLFRHSDDSFEGDLIGGIEKCIISCAGNFLEIKGDRGTSLPG